MAFWAAKTALGSDERGKPPLNTIVAASGTTTTCSPISRRNKSPAVVFPPPGPPVKTMRQGVLSEDRGRYFIAGYSQHATPPVKPCAKFV
jgi:hypothetical protein